VVITHEAYRKIGWRRRRATQRIIIVREKPAHDLGRLSGLEVSDSMPFTRSVDAELRHCRFCPMHSVELPHPPRS
jgi:hypothetical protein